MTPAQTKLIREAASVEVDGEGWRRRMDEWLSHREADLFGWYFGSRGIKYNPQERPLTKLEGLIVYLVCAVIVSP